MKTAPFIRGGFYAFRREEFPVTPKTRKTENSLLFSLFSGKMRGLRGQRRPWRFNYGTAHVPSLPTPYHVAAFRNRTGGQRGQRRVKSDARAATLRPPLPTLRGCARAPRLLVEVAGTSPATTIHLRFMCVSSRLPFKSTENPLNVRADPASAGSAPPAACVPCRLP
jgi:hypothetical protein